MARRRNTIAQFVNFDMAELATRIQGMTDAQIGAWWRKAVIDCCSGCIDPKTDPIIRARYDWSLKKMSEKQNHDVRTYQNRKNRLNDQEANDSTATTPCATTVSTNPSQEAPTRKAGDELNEPGNGSLRNPHPSCEEHLDEARLSHQDSPSGEALVNQGSASGSTVRGLAKVPQPGADSPADLFPEDTAKKPYGTCKHVMLTDADGHHLREVYSADLALAIEILDAYLENNPKALKKYKNHAAVLRKGNWVWQKVQENKLTAKRLENANTPKNNKSFKQQDLDARTEFFTHSIFDNGDVQ
ncbi:MAG: hypothetical protein IKB97_09175 [Bacteroidaceae bacterium]|nr:hypothetical protein [Bacteroidaceae bacterium]